MAEGKWIPDLTAETPLAVAARRTLTLRLEAVESCLKSAAETAPADLEHVHQLRVATRRCRAALDLFASVLSTKLWKKLRKLLRRIRRTAGPARDADVFFLALAPRLAKATPRTAPGLHWIAGQVAAARARAQEALVAVCAKLEKKLAHVATGPLIHEDSSHNGAPTLLGPCAAEQILALLDKLEAAGRGDLQGQEELHQLRIAGKRLRYAMEVFADCFPPDFREAHYPRIEEMQELLGEINDAHVALDLLKEMQAQAQAFYPQHWRLWQPGVSALRTVQRQWLKRAHQRFQRFWESLRLDELRTQAEALIPAQPAEAP